MEKNSSSFGGFALVPEPSQSRSRSRCATSAISSSIHFFTLGRWPYRKDHKYAQNAPNQTSHDHVGRPSARDLP